MEVEGVEEKVKQAHVFVSGVVQGVGYRYFARSWAKKFGLSGWARNLDDGRVECLLQGDREVIEKLIERCRKGPFLADVKNIEIVWEEVEDELGGFEAR